MITGISIENFKGIRERVELELKPLTLLFGPNSAGKSTILHALHYAREVFERHNLDADRTITGGDFVDLGGFAGFVHGHDRGQSVVLRIDISLEGDELPSFDAQFDLISRILEIEVETFAKPIQTAAVELVVSWSDLEKRAFVSKCTTILDGQPFSEITSNPNLRGVVVSAIALDHPALTTVRDAKDDDSDQPDLFGGETLLSLAMTECGEVIAPGDGRRIELGRRGDALPEVDEPLDFEYAPFSPSKDKEEDEKLASQLGLAGEVVKGISQVIIGPCQLVRDQLCDFRYLGPLRKTPPRLYSPPRFPDPSRWASGLGAWDALCSDGEELVEQVNDWLSDNERLDTGYRLLLQNYKELDLGDPLVIQLLTGRAFDEAEDARLDLESLPTRSRLVIVPNGSPVELQPHDVGIGIAQIVPVVVTALAESPGLSAIEQPELHVHPRVQAEMGDLFIESALQRKRRFLIETHSEHLVLRLQRRIRQTGKGQLTRGIPITGNDVAVYFVNQEDGQTKIRRIDIDKNGEFIQPWPDDFFEVDFYERFQ
jgi:hypothetical protein